MKNESVHQNADARQSTLFYSFFFSSFQPYGRSLKGEEAKAGRCSGMQAAAGAGRVVWHA